MTTLELNLPIDSEAAADRLPSAPEPIPGSPPGRRAQPASAPSSGAVTGTLIGFRDDARTPLVLFPGQSGSAAIAAVTTVDLQGKHIGSHVVLLFERGDSRRPIIVGVVRGASASGIAEQPGHVEIDADGSHLLVTAKEQLVLQCGKASITLTKAGKVLIQGAYVSHRSSGVMRIKGGSVQMN
jgi:hypothetical protein